MKDHINQFFLGVRILFGHLDCIGPRVGYFCPQTFCKLFWTSNKLRVGLVSLKTDLGQQIDRYGCLANWNGLYRSFLASFSLLGLRRTIWTSLCSNKMSTWTTLGGDFAVKILVIFYSSYAVFWVGSPVKTDLGKFGSTNCKFSTSGQLNRPLQVIFWSVYVLWACTTVPTKLRHNFFGRSRINKMSIYATLRSGFEHFGSRNFSRIFCIPN